MAENLSAGELALGGLLDQSSELRPDELPAAISRAAATMGLEDALLHVVDKRQTILTPFPGDGDAVEIDGTSAGRCYREMAIVAEEIDLDAVRLWFPIVDGTTRMGVLEAVAADDTALLRTRGRQLGELCGELLVSKSQYGDHILQKQRREDMTLEAEIRWALVPPMAFLNPEISIAGFLEPAYDIAGDTFDYAVNAARAHVAIFDAVGHGMEATRIANMAQLSYRHSRRGGLGLVESYRALDEVVRETFDSSAFVTANLTTLDLDDGRLRWVSAGHPPPILLRRSQRPELLTADPALPAGIATGEPQVHERDLEPGDLIALYSDGITEARAADGTSFGEDRLVAMLDEFAGERRLLPELTRQVVRAVVDHQDGDVVDDATLVLIAWRL